MFENSSVHDTVQQASVSAADSIKQVLSHGASEHGEEFSFLHLLDHTKDSQIVELPGFHFTLPKLPPLQIGGLMIDISPTKHVFFLVLCAVILVIIAVTAVRAYRKNMVPHGFVNLFEILVLFIRDEVAVPNMGHGGIKYLPYLLTTFFYILVMNLIGLIPYGATATSNVMVTAGLAIVAFFMIQISAIRSQGLKHYLLHLTGGVHWGLWIIMIPIEILGLFTKPFALCIRLFANMSAGHIVILSLLGLIFMFHSVLVAPASVAFALFVNMLELFVAVLQAYIFTMLTSVFMGFGIQTEQENH
ncbi:MAG: F0F1 ATP synthase subunit A [Bacteroidetes bacterium]|nr:F0F1 ATP synthase subunit A [Bacteroidota bacterium]